MVESMTIQEFLDVLSSKEPVPGGGGASALAGALGNALGQMVANLTIGKKKYALVEDEIKELAERMKGIQGQFTALADQDAKVFAPLAKCYSLPSGTEEEKAYKAEVMEARLLDASLVPMEIMEKASEMLEIMDILADKGSRMAVSDVGVGVQFIRTALLGAVMNVYINTKSMKNREKAEEMNEKAERLIKEGTEAADRIYQKVLEQLREKAAGREENENENIKRRRGFGKNQGTGNTDDGRSGRPGSEAGHCAGGGKTGRYVLRTGGCEEDGELRPAGPDICVPGTDKRQRFQG